MVGPERAEALDVDVVDAHPGRGEVIEGALDVDRVLYKDDCAGACR